MTAQPGKHWHKTQMDPRLVVGLRGVVRGKRKGHLHVGPEKSEYVTDTTPMRTNRSYAGVRCIVCTDDIPEQPKTVVVRQKDADAWRSYPVHDDCWDTWRRNTGRAIWNQRRGKAHAS